MYPEEQKIHVSAHTPVAAAEQQQQTENLIRKINQKKFRMRFLATQWRQKQTQWRHMLAKAAECQQLTAAIV